MKVGAVDSAAERAAAPGHQRGQRTRFPRWLRATAFGVSILLTAAVISVLILGPSYQPVASGGLGVRLTGQIVTQRVSDKPALAGQIYLPPQKAADGTITVTLTNKGPFPVTILSATLNYPYQVRPAGMHPLPLDDTGTATFSPLSGTGGGTVAGSVLAPGAVVSVRLPVTAASCWTNSGSYVVISRFWVKYKVAFWTHLVQVSWTSPQGQPGGIVTNEPELASQGGICQS